MSRVLCYSQLLAWVLHLSVFTAFLRGYDVIAYNNLTVYLVLLVCAISQAIIVFFPRWIGMSSARPWRLFFCLLGVSTLGWATIFILQLCSYRQGRQHEPEIAR